jgi:lysophospholipid acyltransferase (LPLAT)-like uncharacterized protein
MITRLVTYFLSVPEDNRKAYEFEPLDKYTWKERLRIRSADLAFYLAIKTIGRTIRWESEGLENLKAVESNGALPIYCLWHDRIFAGTYYLRDRGIVVITSQSKDGEYIARFLKRLGYGTVRGSSSRGGVKALVEMIRGMRLGMAMAFTVDGPRGPRYVAKSGAVLLAKKTGNPMLPFSVALSSFWTVKSWDRMQIPKPFARARFILGPPIYVPSDATDDVLEAKRNELQSALDGLVAVGESWKKSL